MQWRITCLLFFFARVSPVNFISVHPKIRGQIALSGSS